VTEPERPLVWRALLEDGTLAIGAEARLLGRVEGWIPRLAAGGAEPTSALHVRCGSAVAGPPPHPPQLRLGTVSGWTEAGALRLRGSGGALSALVEPARGRAEVRLGPPAVPAEADRVEIAAGLTVAAAALLGRLGRTLVHAAAVALPERAAWLLVGGTRSGKTTACVSLIRAGWDFLADDQVVLGAGASPVDVEGWPRPFNLDVGDAVRTPRGVRRRIEAEAFGPGRLRRRAPLAGLLFPRVEPDAPTSCVRLEAGTVLAALLPHSPWLLTDPASAPAVLALLRHAADLPAFSLRLGIDGYRDPLRLSRVVAEATAGAPDPPGALDGASAAG
jgi:hypothetical protein